MEVGPIPTHSYLKACIKIRTLVLSCSRAGDVYIELDRSCTVGIARVSL